MDLEAGVGPNLYVLVNLLGQNGLCQFCLGFVAKFSASSGVVPGCTTLKTQQGGQSIIGSMIVPPAWVPQCNIVGTGGWCSVGRAGWACRLCVGLSVALSRLEREYQLSVC